MFVVVIVWRDALGSIAAVVVVATILLANPVRLAARILALMISYAWATGDLLGASFEYASRSTPRTPITLGIISGLRSVQPASTVAVVLALLLWQRVADLVVIVGIVWRDAPGRFAAIALAIPESRGLLGGGSLAPGGQIVVPAPAALPRIRVLNSCL